MKEKFQLIIETLHADDAGDRENVSSCRSNVINRRPFLFSFAFLLRAASSMFKNSQTHYTKSLPKHFQTVDNSHSFCNNVKLAASAMDDGCESFRW